MWPPGAPESRPVVGWAICGQQVWSNRPEVFGPDSAHPLDQCDQLSQRQAQPPGLIPGPRPRSQSELCSCPHFSPDLRDRVKEEGPLSAVCQALLKDSRRVSLNGLHPIFKP